MRTAGVLMHITSLPSPYGIGTLGAEAKAFVRFLSKAGQRYWQILPICPTGYGDSPYQSYSSYAGNPYMIDLDLLEEEGLLEKDDYQNIDWGDNPEYVDFEKIYFNRFKVLNKACEKINAVCGQEFQKFAKDEQFWLDDYALFMALKDHYNGVAWQEWPDEIKKRDPEALAKVMGNVTEQVENWKMIQFLFFRQWNELKKYANDHEVSIIGDIPIYVSADSVDVWANPAEFQLDQSLQPTEVAGCPPDGFSADGQLWGNPLFDWEAMRKNGYQWWINRVSYQTKIYDVLRIDHFRGFDEYFAIPFGDKTARNGSWKQGPGIELFRKIEEALGRLPIIAEDLGFLTDTVIQLLEDSGFPGMKVLEFAFDSRDTGSGYLPHCYPKNCIVYTGTHDNDTILGWMQNAPAEDVQLAKEYLRLNEAEGYHWGMMRSAWASIGDTAIMQMQDLLGLGSEARMNIPSTLGLNWKWRCKTNTYSDDLAERIYHEMKIYHRLSE